MKLFKLTTVLLLASTSAFAFEGDYSEWTFDERWKASVAESLPLVRVFDQVEELASASGAFWFEEGGMVGDPEARWICRIGDVSDVLNYFDWVTDFPQISFELRAEARKDLRQIVGNGSVEVCELEVSGGYYFNRVIAFENLDSGYQLSFTFGEED